MNHTAQETDDTAGAPVLAVSSHQDVSEREEPGFLERYGPYVQDLWRRLYRVTIVFAISFVASFFLAKYVVAGFLDLFRFHGVVVIATSPFQFIDLAVDIAFLLSAFITIPFSVWQLCVFIRPAMSLREFRLFLLTIPLSIVLFAIGFAYGFFTLYWGLQVLADLNVSVGLANYWDIGPFLAGLVLTATLLGALFQFPLVASLLMRMGMFDASFLVRHRRVAWVLILVFVALLPPTDGVSLIVMSVPLVFLYELTILLNRK